MSGATTTRRSGCRARSRARAGGGDRPPARGRPPRRPRLLRRSGSQPRRGPRRRGACTRCRRPRCGARSAAAGRIWGTFMNPEGSLDRLETLAREALPELEASGDDVALWLAYWCLRTWPSTAAGSSSRASSASARSSTRSGSLLGITRSGRRAPPPRSTARRLRARSSPGSKRTRPLRGAGTTDSSSTAQWRSR